MSSPSLPPEGPSLGQLAAEGPGKPVERWALVQDPPTAPAHLVTWSPSQEKGGVYTATGTRRQPRLRCWNNLLARPVCEGEAPGDRGRVIPEKLREQHAPAAASSVTVSLQDETRGYLMRYNMKDRRLPAGQQILVGRRAPNAGRGHSPCRHGTWKPGNGRGPR